MARGPITRGCLFVRRLPEGVKNHFKGVCARRNQNMRDVIAALMRLYIDRPEAIDTGRYYVRTRRKGSDD